MTTHLLFIALSLLLLFAGAEGLIRGSASLAMRLGLSKLVVGLTVVAFGTSSPELLVSLEAALGGQGDIAIGNVIGSNSFNIGIILGITAIVCPIPVHRQIIRFDAPIALGVAILALFLFRDHRVGRIEGGFLVAGIVAYTWINLIFARRETQLGQDGGAAVPTSPLPARHWAIDLGLIAAGLGLLVIGARLLSDHSVTLARGLGVSDAVIGLTIVAAGTSLPELATSIVAAIRRQADIAVGNVVGSNLFNILGILGISSLVQPLDAPGISIVDVGAMILFSLLLIPLLYTGKTLHRIEGLLLLGLYIGYVAYLWPN